jgi:SPX domain protein involved in polyphosphate accumulation
VPVLDCGCLLMLPSVACGCSSLNMVAFGKILKKHDKSVGWNASRPYLAAVEQAHFQASTQVVHMMAATEALFAKQFAGASHKQAMQVLRPPHRSASHQVTYALGEPPTQDT